MFILARMYQGYMEESLTVERLRDHLTEVVTTRDCRLVLVDQLDLFADTDRRATEQEHVSAISKALKQIAKDLQIVVLCLVQPSRNLESRTGVQGNRPQQADLRQGTSPRRMASSRSRCSSTRTGTMPSFSAITPDYSREEV